MSKSICSWMHAFFLSGEKASHTSDRTALLAFSTAWSYASSSSDSESWGGGDGDPPCTARVSIKPPLLDDTSGGGWVGDIGWNLGGGPSQPLGGAIGEAGVCWNGGEEGGLEGAEVPTVSCFRRERGRDRLNTCLVCLTAMYVHKEHTRQSST